MMIKKRYIILALGIVSVLLGSLFYNIVLAQKGKLTIYKDSVEITALDWIARTYSDATTSVKEYGTLLRHKYYAMYTWQETRLELPFVFSPRQSFLNVTDLWIQLVASTFEGGDEYKFNITINGMITFESSIEQPKHLTQPYLNVYSVHVTNESVYQLMTEGINEVTISDPIYYATGGWHYAQLQIFRVTVFIEYEYLE